MWFQQASMPSELPLVGLENQLGKQTSEGSFEHGNAIQRTGWCAQPNLDCPIGYIALGGNPQDPEGSQSNTHEVYYQYPNISTPETKKPTRIMVN